MNKYLKLSLFFAAIIGVVVVLSLKDSIFSSSTNSRSDSKYSELSGDIKNTWKDQKQWDEECYKSCMDKINKDYRKSYITSDEFHLLFGVINSEAVNTINGVFDAEMKKSDCNSNVIEKNKEGLDFISEYKNPYNEDYDFSQDERLITAYSMYSQYKDIIAFCEKDFHVSPKIDDNCEWIPFSQYVSSWNKDKGRHSNGEYYESHFSKIEKVRIAWSEYDTKVNQSKDSYYNDLAILIKRYFDKRYIDKELEDNQNELIAYYNNLNTINNNLKSRFNEVIGGYNSIKNKYNSIKNRISDYDKEINDCRYGSNKYYDRVKAKSGYIKNVKDDNQYNMGVKTDIDTLKSDFENNKGEMNDLIIRIDDYQSNLDKYDRDLRTVNNEFKNQSSFNVLDQYYNDKIGDITTLLNDLPIIPKDQNNKYNSNNSYISSLEGYSEELMGIINYINEL